MYHIIDIMWLFAFYGMRQRKDMENRCSSLKRGDITISPQRMKFINHGILFVTEEGKSDSLDEDRILLACIEQSGKDGVIRTRLPVEEITSDTEGRFFLGTIYGTRCEIQTNRMGATAGELLMEIVRHYPWLWIGDHECLDSGDRKKWQELQNMVEQMRACSILLD